MIPRWTLLLVLLLPATTAQISIDEIINRALSLVRPIFDTSAPLQDDSVVTKQMEQSATDRRDSSILGSRICQFLSCSAENFKKDQAFSNIQLGAQILADKKLRQAVSSNPEAIDAVCREQGLGGDECKIFSKGFQLIDKFITTIEEPKEEGAKNVQSDPIPIPIQKDNEVIEDDYPSIPVASSDISKPIGSQTWSSHPVQPQNDAQMYEVRNDLVASLAPPPFPPSLPSLFFPLPHPVAPPSPPTAPPLAFPTVPSLILPGFKLPELDKGLFFSSEKFTFGPPGDKNELIRMKREEEVDEFDDFEESVSKIRSKREYYDELTGNQETATTSQKGAKEKQPEDYYGALDDDMPKKPPPPNPLRDCVNLLGLRG